MVVTKVTRGRAGAGNWSSDPGRLESHPHPPPPSLRGMGGFNANRRKPLEFLVQEETKPATLGSSKYTERGRITIHWGLDSLDFILKEFRGCVYARGCKAPKHSYPGQGWGREPQGDLEG